MLSRSFFAALLAFVVPVTVSATVLTFDITGAGFGEDSTIPPTYGSRATAASNTSGIYTFGYGNFGEGYTPNVTAAYGQPASFFDTGYGSLTNVAYANTGLFSLTLAADPGFFVSLFSFDLAGFGSAYQINSVSVIYNTSTYSQSNVTVSGTDRTSFDFTAAPLTAQQITVQFDATNLGPVTNTNVAIDNIRFAQVPEPSVTVIAITLTGAAIALRRRRSL